MKFTLERAVQRIEALAQQATGTRELVDFYRRVLAVQRDTFNSLSRLPGGALTGDPARDLGQLRPGLTAILKLGRSHGPQLLADSAQALLEAPDAELDDMVVDYWQNPSDLQFFAKTAIQAYCLVISGRGVMQLGKVVDGRENRCRVCSGKPQLTYLEAHEQEGSMRNMQCAICLSSWTFRRVVCANCLEEDPRKLGYFSTPDLAHVRVETCDTCKYYIKGIDLGVLGLAVPLVDEVAAAPLDIWAREQGYTKIELNLVGL
jgi:formate dehydrogenase accessory protein FdhE